MVKVKHPKNIALDIFNYIISKNTKPFIAQDKVLMEKLRRRILDNSHLIIELFEEVNTKDKLFGDPNKAFEKLMTYDSYHAKHGIDVENKVLDITRYLNDYNFDPNLPFAARLHDFGKIIIENDLKFKEEVKGEDLKLIERLEIQHGHTLYGECLGILCGLHPTIIHAAACHHDKHPDYPYPHISMDKVIETPSEIRPEVYSKKCFGEKEKIRNSTDLVIVGNDIISVADTVCSMSDSRRSYDRVYTNEEIYKVLIDRVNKGCYDKKIVEAFLRSEGITQQKEINDLFEKYKSK